MRITNSITTRQYKTQLNKMESAVSSSLNQVSSGLAMTNFSDDTTSAVRAYKIRSTMSKIDSYQANISQANSSLVDSESALNNINSIYQEAMQKIVQGQNATQSDDERSIIATELRSLQEELLSSLNTSVTSSYLFGGTNTTTEPFTLDAVTGKLIYNGSTLDTTDAATAATLSDDARYVNIGLNMQFDGAGELIDSTGFSYSISGIDIVGYGTTTTTVDGASITISNNLYDLIGQIADQFDAGTGYDYNTVDAMYEQFETAGAGVSQGLTQVGAKENYLEFMSNRYETQELNLTEAKSNIEDVDEASALIEYKTNEVAYEAALQMGANIIQYSIFDYMS